MSNEDQPNQAPLVGGELRVDDLDRPWKQPETFVEVWEVPATEGWSLYRLAGSVGGAAVVMETIRDEWRTPLLFNVVARIVANLTRVCPSCGARAVLDSVQSSNAAHGQMAHEAECPLTNEGMKAAAATPAEPRDPAPSPPRFWRIWIPRLKPGYRPRARFQ